MAQFNQHPGMAMGYGQQPPAVTSETKRLGDAMHLLGSHVKTVAAAFEVRVSLWGKRR